MGSGEYKYSNSFVANVNNDEIQDETPDETDQKTKVFDYQIENQEENFRATDPMVASLNRTLAHKDTINTYNSSTGLNQTLNNSLAYSQTAGTMLKNTLIQVPMDVIQSEDDEGTSQTSEIMKAKAKKHKNSSDSDEDLKDDIDRFEDIGRI
jgi:hypothetical protein